MSAPSETYHPQMFIYMHYVGMEYVDYLSQQ